MGKKIQKKIQKKIFPKKFNEKVHPKNSPVKFTQKAHPKGSPKKFTQKERNKNIQKEPRRLTKSFRMTTTTTQISVFRSSSRSHATHAIGELKKNYKM